MKIPTPIFVISFVVLIVAIIFVVLSKGSTLATPKSDCVGNSCAIPTQTVPWAVVCELNTTTGGVSLDGRLTLSPPRVNFVAKGIASGYPYNLELISDGTTTYIRSSINGNWSESPSTVFEGIPGKTLDLNKLKNLTSDQLIENLTSDTTICHKVMDVDASIFAPPEKAAGMEQL